MFPEGSCETSSRLAYRDPTTITKRATPRATSGRPRFKIMGQGWGRTVWYWSARSGTPSFGSQPRVGEFKSLAAHHVQLGPFSLVKITDGRVVSPWWVRAFRSVVQSELSSRMPG
jgi:hypothetical protein